MTRSLWDDEDAAQWAGDLRQRVYTSRLLGRDPDLVLHGGGNTSVKSRHSTLFGDEVDVLLVKGSGADLADIDESGFSSLRLDAILRLAELESLSDAEMARQLLLATTSPEGPKPSVETIVHAVLPYRFVDHTHADAVVTLTNSPVAKAALEETYGDDVIVIPYVMPGFKLARACAERVREGLGAGALGVVLMNHGMFTFGDTAKESYDRMIEAVSRAETYLGRHLQTTPAKPSKRATVSSVVRAELRRSVSEAAGSPVVISSHRDDEVMAFLARPDLGTVSQRGPVTPDHVIRTKPWPLLGRDVEAYSAAYRRYFEEHRYRATTDLQALDAAPRVILDSELGLCCVGRTPKEASIVEDLYRHTMKVITDAVGLGGYEPVALPDLFDVEYWDLEQAKLRGRGAPPPMAGEVALVTGAASGIGRACAEALLGEGAAVVGVDVAATIETVFDGPGWAGLQVDVTEREALARALEVTTERFGGLDVLVVNAGVFPGSAAIGDLDFDAWERTMGINVDANAALLHQAYPLLRTSPGGARVVVIGSRNVHAPGPGAAAYSASKAALTQLARVAALEWASDGIRVNVIHPDGVFDTGVWTTEVLEQRAAHYGLSVEEYRSKNLLGVEVTSADVARACIALCGPAFVKTTGAQIPVDGGNART
ncbi:MAG: bifunctional aldolase/short-chain dehydrogenase, partial [Actinomycetota bacterium]|nr:bifunctional aldolase/short-chain dehydrogenase [Actinomycetota bacterium]